MHNVAVVWGVLFYQCPLSILEERIMERAKESGRSDDNRESLRQRFKTFEGDTVPVIDTLRLVQDETLLQVVDIRGDQSVEKVWQDSQKTMNGFLSNDILCANAKLLQAVANQDADLYQSLCADEMFASQSPSAVMAAQEGINGSLNASKASLEWISGTKAVLSCDRTFGGIVAREIRVWSHQGVKGWRTIHFSRVPSS
jgi:hypothetical protein